MVQIKHLKLACRQARDVHGRFASGHTSSPPSSNSLSEVEMWTYVTPFDGEECNSMGQVG
jgi:hypothetical protein